MARNSVRPTGRSNPARRAIFATSLGCALVAVSPAARAERLPIRVYTIADGLPHDRINRVMRDSRGFLWFCTPGGLARFDGDRFTTYRQDDGLPSDSVNDILEDGAVYWVATNGGGVARFDPDAGRAIESPPDSGAPAPKFTVFRVGDSPATNRVNALYKDRAGRLWAATDGGLFLFDQTAQARPGRFRRERLTIPGYAENAIQVWRLAEDGAGNLWIGTSRGLVRRLADGTTEFYSVRPEAGVDHVWTLLVDRNGRLLIGHNGGLLVLQLETRRAAQPQSDRHRRLEHLGVARWYTGRDRIGVIRVRAVYQTMDGRVWIGSDAGLVEFDGRRLRPLATQHPVDTVVDAFEEDTAGNLWIGSGSGATRLARGGFTSYDQADGLVEVPTPVLLGTRAGELCAVSPRHVVHVFDGERFHAVRPVLPESPAAGTFAAALEDHLGEWWMADGEDLYRFAPVASVRQLGSLHWKERYTRASGLAGGAISRLFEDSRGDIWIATRVPPREVVTRWERSTGSFHRYGTEHGLPTGDPAGWFVEDRTGNIWIGFWNGSGVARYHDGAFTWIPSPAQSWGGTSLLLDREGRLWIGSLGLWRIDDPSASRPVLARFTISNFTPRGVVLLAEDRHGQLYLRTSDGLIRLDPRTAAVRRYTSADGLAGMEAKAAYLAPDGTLWFAMTNGLSRFDPTAPEISRSPTVAIERIHVAGAARSTGELGSRHVKGVTLQPSQREIQIDYFATSFEGGHVLRYQYRLDAIDADWSSPTRERSVTYAHLAPGRYRFRVRAVNARGLASVSTASVEFAVMAPLWRTPWFLAIAATLVLLGLYGAYAYHVRRLLEVERVRIRIATDLHDDIGSSLSQIAILSEVAQKRRDRTLSASVEDPLAQIASTSREVIDSMADIVWAINPRRDRLSDLSQRMRRFASDVLPARGIEFTFSAPQSDQDIHLGADMRRHVFLIFKESVTNVVRHSGAAHAEIALRADRHTLHLTVADDGRGRSSFAGDSAFAQGHGLASMRTRARELGGTLQIDAPETGGLTVALTVPLRRRLRDRFGCGDARDRSGGRYAATLLKAGRALQRLLAGGGGKTPPTAEARDTSPPV